MAMLTPQERIAFTLRHQEGRSIEDIGKALGIQQSAAKHAVFRAVKKLRAALEPLRPSASAPDVASAADWRRDV
jgi:RNA polymerase sigma-70 factor (ECF subfamily)